MNRSLIAAVSVLFVSRMAAADSTSKDEEIEIEASASVTTAAARRPAGATSARPDAAVNSAASTTAATDASPTSLNGSGGNPDAWKISGYLQSQYQSSQLSEDQLDPSGMALNQDRFVIRRARLRLTGEWNLGSLLLEVDGNTVRGISASIRRAEASLVWRNADRMRPPLAQLSAGLIDMPFGSEMRQGQEELLFMERSTGSMSLFPGLQDTGVRLSGALGVFRYAAAVVNGTPVDDRTGGTSVDPTRAPDLLGRLGIEAHPTESLGIIGGVSWLSGTGFSAGSIATKNRTEWRDLNENGIVDMASGELVASPGTAARPSSTFGRWALNADLEARLAWSGGVSHLYAEATMASNLDRALVVADPITTGRDARELAWSAGLLHDVASLGFVGLRYDAYFPDLDALDARRGRLLVTDLSVHTIAPLLGWRISEKARLTLQYNLVRDHWGRNLSGVPDDLANDSWQLRLHVGL
jgi:hypothetical protein